MRASAAVLIVLMLPAGLSGQVTGDATVTVTGTGSVERLPDRAMIKLRIQASGASTADALSEHAAIVNRVVEGVRALSGSAAEVRAGSPSVWPRRAWGRAVPGVDTAFVVALQVHINAITPDTAAIVLNALADVEPPPSLSGSMNHFSISLRLEVRGSDAGDALRSANERLEALRQSLGEAGVAPSAVGASYQLSTATSPYSYSGQRPGYEHFAYSSADVRLDSLALLSRVIDAIQESGAGVSHVSYGLRDHDAALNEAYRKAVQNARDQAEALAAAAGASLGGVESISFPTPQRDYFPYISVASATERESTESPLDRPPTPIDVRVQVVVRYKLEQ